MTNVLNAPLLTCPLDLAQPIGFWDQSEWLECVCFLEIVREVLRFRSGEETNVCGHGLAFGWRKEFE
jgi:hypothetical protein